MSKESVVEIPAGSGNKYRYMYNPESQRTEYLGPIGDAPEIGEAEFLRLVSVPKDEEIVYDLWSNKRQLLLNEMKRRWENFGPTQYSEVLTEVENLGMPDGVGENIMYWHKPTHLGGKKKAASDAKPTGYNWVMIKDEEIVHKKPIEHRDYCYAGATIEVPDKMIPVLSKMSGSIMYDPLKKEVTARCHALVKNAVTLQAVQDMIDGKIDPKDAGKEYGERIMANGPTGKYWYPKSDLKKAAI